MKQHKTFDINGVRHSSFKITKQQISNLKRSWKVHVDCHIPEYPGKFRGRGIVICAGGMKYFTCAWISIHLLRKNGCILPIELWYKDGELNNEVIIELQKLNVRCMLASSGSNPSLIQDYAIKPFAIINSSFEEVLFLDADNNCLVDPTFLFDHDTYRLTGAIFWPDFWKTDPKNAIWAITEAKDYLEYEQESGQILINKKRCWSALNLCMYFNHHKDPYYKLLLGDKDTFKFAWKSTKTPYTMIDTAVAFCGYSNTSHPLFNKGVAMCQHDFNGKIIFIHQNLAKWDAIESDEFLWSKVKSFLVSGGNRLHIQQAVVLPNGTQKLAFDIDGDVLLKECDSTIIEKEKFCHAELSRLRKSDMYLRYILFLYITRSRGEY